MMNDPADRAIAVDALKHAFPYIRLFKGKRFVIKAGGAVFSDAEQTRALMEQVAILHQLGIQPVVVHGGGPQATALSAALGIESRFVEGRRVTDAKALDVATMVLNGSINTRLLAALRDLDIPAVGLSGIDAGLIRARRRAPVRLQNGGSSETVDYGFVGDIVSVDPGVIVKLLSMGLLPVVSPLSADAQGTVLNINADTVAAAIAASLGAEKLLLLTGAPGILRRPGDPSSLISYIDLAGLELLREAGSLERGMLPKTDAIRAAIEGGVRRVHVISHDQPDSLLIEVFTNEGAGTMVVEDIEVLTNEEQIA